jgi:hypothetical protein
MHPSGTPAADIFFGSALVAIGLVFVVLRRRVAEDSRLFFPIPAGWNRFGRTYDVIFGVLVAGLRVLAIAMGVIPG